ncbi:MAG: aminotransferase class I/II-fold pyridoxal phosphate-dependent enzyme [Acidobacteriota bacterium]
MVKPDDHLETRAIHAGEDTARDGGSVVTPIYQSTVWNIDESGGYADLGYIRYSNLPNHRVLADKLANLENAERALVAASGMAAISSALLGHLSTGDHLLVSDVLYGGTHELVTRMLPRFGIEYDFIDADRPDTWEAKRRPSTRVIYVETISNPLMRVPPMDEVGEFARRHGLTAMTDNTFATPINFRPAEHGFHLSLHSATKYMNGHSDLVAGALCGTAEAIERAKGAAKLLGGSLDPHACFLLQRGLKTLGLRMRQHNRTGLALARHLAGHRAVERVHYPGLEGQPDHARAARLLNGFGGMLAFEPVGGAEAADRILRRTRLATHAPSLGGVESLIVSPARSSHAAMSPEERRRVGIGDGLVRISTGIEHPDDLIADLDQALSQ